MTINTFTKQLKQRAGAIALDLPRYLWTLNQRTIRGGPAWVRVCNRKDKFITTSAHFGVQCDWQWTSDLHLPKVFPSIGRDLMQRALQTNPITLSDDRPNTSCPNASFIIGHRGLTRLPLLLETIRSIAGQNIESVECIVVEQDTESRIQSSLPTWVNYQLMRMDNELTPYSRAGAFNYGRQFARSNCLIFHDNDLLVANSYAAETRRWLQSGYDFVNLKRFIFYLSESSTESLHQTRVLDDLACPESVMQNAEGGGSIGTSATAFDDIGQFDARFVGWGGEDNEFWERAATRRIWPFGYLPLVHLWHAAQAEKMSLETATTTRLYRKLSKVSPEQRIQDLLTLNQTNDAT